MGGPFGCGDNRGGVMTADVEERSQEAVLAAHRDDRLARDLRRDEASRCRDLFGAGDDLPRTREHAAAFELEDPLVEVPRRRYRGRALRSEERRVGEEW